MNKATLTITAASASKTYGQALSYGAGSTAFTPVGLQNSETIASVTLSSTGSAASADVGNYNIVASDATGGTFSAANYSITFVAGTLTVNKKELTVSGLSAANHTYDGATQIALTGGTLVGVISGDTVDLVRN